MTTLNLIIPVYNEASRLAKTFSTLNSWRIPSCFKVNQVIFVDDGSTDNSLKILKNTYLKFDKKIISYKQNKGKGHAVKRGMLASKNADYTLLLDADMATRPTEIKKFIPFIKKNIDIIIGTRKNGHSTVTIHQPMIRENMGRVFTKLSQFILNVPVTDFTCGFKAFKNETIRPIFSRSIINRWGYDAEIIFIANKLNYSLVEKSVSWADQKGTKVNLLKDAVSSLKELIQIRTNHLIGNYNLKPKFSILKVCQSL